MEMRETNTCILVHMSIDTEQRLLHHIAARVRYDYERSVLH